MKPPIIITSDKTRLNALESRFDNLGCFRLSRYGSEWEEPGQTFVLDASFDIYDPEVRAETLYEHFSTVQKTLRSIDPLEKNFYVVRDYPFSSNDKRLSILAHILEKFVETLTVYYGAKILYTPLIVSRYSINRLKDPVSSIIAAVRLGKSAKIDFQDGSKAPVVYDQDFLASLMEACETFDGRSRVVEGSEMTLASVSSIAQTIAGEAPLRFDVKNFIHYRYPDDSSGAVGQINYGLENMMIDLIDKLF